LKNFIKDLTWIRGAFPPSPKSDPKAGHQIDSYVDYLQSTFDALGAAKINDFFLDFQSAANTSAVGAASVVPGGKIRWLLFASAHHDDAGANHTLWVAASMNQAGNTRVLPVVNGLSVPANLPVCIERTILLAPGTQLQARSLNATGVGNTLNLTACWVELPLGEYIVLPS